MTGDPVLACMDGIVLKVIQGTTGYGRHVVLAHDDGWYTTYGHLSETLCKEGDRVSKGQKIGLAGSTGNSTGPHLHLIAQWMGHGSTGYILPDVVDPLKFL